MKKILHMVTIKAPAKDVYDAITTQQGLSSWWVTRVALSDTQVDFNFMEGMTPNMKIEQAEAGSLLRWRCVGGHDNWLDNTFTFALSEGEGAVNLMFTQDYAQELPDPVYGMYNYNWGYYLDSLREYCEKGEGKPFDPGA